jgi:hypothetical protein
METQIEYDVFDCQFFSCFKSQYDYCKSCTKIFCEEHVIDHGKCTPLSSYGNGNMIFDSDNNDNIFIDSDRKHIVIDDDNNLKDSLSNDNKTDLDEINEVSSDKGKCMLF